MVRIVILLLCDVYRVMIFHTLALYRPIAGGGAPPPPPEFWKLKNITNPQTHVSVPKISLAQHKIGLAKYSVSSSFHGSFHQTRAWRNNML